MTSLLHYSKKCGKVNIYHGKGERMRKWLKRLFAGILITESPVIISHMTKAVI